jgi:hypothetical protein
LLQYYCGEPKSKKELSYPTLNITAANDRKDIADAIGQK